MTISSVLPSDGQRPPRGRARRAHRARARRRRRSRRRGRPRSRRAPRARPRTGRATRWRSRPPRPRRRRRQARRTHGAPRPLPAPASRSAPPACRRPACWRTAASRPGTCQRSSAPIHQSSSHPAARGATTPRAVDGGIAHASEHTDRRSAAERIRSRSGHERPWSSAFASRSMSSGTSSAGRRPS